MPDPLLKSKPLPPRPSLLDRIEYAMQWLIRILTIRLDDKPALSGCLSGLLMGGSISLIALAVWWLAHLQEKESGYLRGKKNTLAR
jgi:hypothetical protein